MDARLLDVIIGLAGFFIMVVMLAVLPMIMPQGMPGLAYLAAIIIFIVFLSGAGYLVNRKIA